MKSIAKTGFFVSVASYGIFLLADYVRPGFVSSVFSVHLFLIPVLAFGIWYGLEADEEAAKVSGVSKVLGMLIRLLLGLILAMIVWREGEVFGDFRLVLAIVAFLLPWINIKKIYA